MANPVDFAPFFERILIKDEDVPRAEMFLHKRGFAVNMEVLMHLEFIKGDNVKVTYEELSSAFRYDKRIRRVLFKYINYVEEIMRASIANNYPCMEDLPKKGIMNELKDALKKCEDKESTSSVLDWLTFQHLVNIFLKLPEEAKRDSFAEPLSLSKENLNIVVALRNMVSHNRYLLNIVLRVKGSDVGDATLTDGLKALYEILPDDESRKNFREDIHDAANERKNRHNYQADWRLLPELRLKFKKKCGNYTI